MPKERFALAIFGGRGAGLLLADTARRCAQSGQQIDINGFLNDVETPGTSVGGIRVLGPFEQWKALPADVRFAAPLHKVGQMAKRIRRIEALSIPEVRWQSIVDPTTITGSAVELGCACFLAAYSVIKSTVRIGHHVAIRDQVSIGHNTVIEDYAFIATGAFVGAYCQVGRGAYVGPLASIRENVRIGEMAIVGMGAVVLQDVPAGTTVVGNPAKPRGISNAP